jgi:hypothetical protein
MASWSRTGSANLGETQALMDDVKRILVFSDTGGTRTSAAGLIMLQNSR